jgi:hypothetical protein
LTWLAKVVKTQRWYTAETFKNDDFTWEKQKRWRVGRFYLEIQERLYALAELPLETRVCGKGFLLTLRDVQVIGVIWVEALESLACSAPGDERRRYSSLPHPRLGLLTRADKLMPYDSCPDSRRHPGRPRAPGLSDVLGNNQKNPSGA